PIVEPPERDSRDGPVARRVGGGLGARDEGDLAARADRGVGEREAHPLERAEVPRRDVAERRAGGSALEIADEVGERDARGRVDRPETAARRAVASLKEHHVSTVDHRALQVQLRAREAGLVAHPRIERPGIDDADALARLHEDDALARRRRSRTEGEEIVSDRDLRLEIELEAFVPSHIVELARAALARK